MLFEEVYSVWTEGRLTQEEAEQLLEIVPAHVPTLGGPVGGSLGLRDKRLSRASHRTAPAGVRRAGSRSRWRSRTRRSPSS